MVKNQLIKKVIGSGAVSALLLVLFLTGVLSRFEYMAQDRLYQDFGIIHPDIFVYGIDEETLIEFGPLQFWSRQRMADAIDILNSVPGWEPAVIAVDLLYSGPSGDDEADAALVRAAEEGGNVIFGAAVSLDFRGEVSTFERSFDALKQVSTCGLINGIIDPDGVVRRVEFDVEVFGNRIPTFPEAIYEMFTGTELDIPPGITSPMHLAFTGRPNDFYGTMGMGTSFMNIFDDDFDPSFYADAIILIGPFAHGLMDSFFTAADLGQPMHGVEIHANTVQMFLDRNFKGFASAWVNLAIMLLTLLLFSFLFMRVDIRISLLILVLFSVGYVFLNRLIFDTGWILTLIYPIISVIVLFVYSLIYRYVNDRIAHITAIAEMNERHFVEVKQLFDSFVRVMTATIDERSPYNANHTVRVAEYIRQFARFLRENLPPDSPHHLDESREEQLVMAAYLHDIGKIVTPPEIMDKSTRLGDRLSEVMYRSEIKKLNDKLMFLSGQTEKDEYERQANLMLGTQEFVERINTSGFLADEDLARVETLTDITYKDYSGNTATVFDECDIVSLSIRRGTLTDAERGVMEEHVGVTGRLLDNMKFNENLEYVAQWAKSHHELMDGSGYPDKLSGNQIPIEVRILTVLDIYDALTARDRPYKRAVPHDKALDILTSMVNEGKLDGEIVSLFAKSGIRMH